MTHHSDRPLFLGQPGHCLDPDADEVLLELLARDAEPPPKHGMPHRRWVAPPMHGGNDAVWRERAPGWWIATSYEELRAAEHDADLERRKRVRAERDAEAKREREMYRRMMYEPAPRQIHDPGKRPAESWLIEMLLKAGEYYQVFLWEREWYQNFLGNER